MSDDEDLSTAYEVAETELDGNLKFIISFRMAPNNKQVDKLDALREARKAKQELKAIKKDVKKEEKKCKKEARVLAKGAKKCRSRSKCGVNPTPQQETEGFVFPNVGSRTERADTCCQPQF